MAVTIVINARYNAKTNQYIFNLPKEAMPYFQDFVNGSLEVKVEIIINEKTQSY